MIRPKRRRKKNIRFKTLVNLFLETGLRIEEIVGIKIFGH